MSERLPRQRSAQSLYAEAERLYRAHSADLEVFLLGVLRDRNLVEDVLQQTFRKLQEFLMRAQASEDSLEERGSGKSADEFSAGWLFRVAYNEAMQVRRRQNLEARHTEGVGWFRNGLQPETRDRLIAEETTRQVRQALEELPQELRTIVELRIEHGMKFREIAEGLQQPLGTVLGKMAQALKKLRVRLEALGDHEA